MKTAKVTEVNGCRRWDGNNGTVWYHSIVLDNGDVGSIGKKQENAINVGDELTYEINGDRIKAVMPQGTGFGKSGGKQGSPASFALSYAKDVMVAAMPFHPDVKVADWVDVTLAAANKFHSFLKERE